LRSCTQQSLRSQFGLVSQEVILFNNSLQENIRMGYLSATDKGKFSEVNIKTEAGRETVAMEYFFTWKFLKK
jgi:ABC-type multidrug transport system fused ATPase/permease subunit